MIIFDNKLIDASIEEILSELQKEITNNKLRTFKRTTSGIRVPCPVHSDGQEKHESCYISDDGIWHCFTCSSKGYLDSFVANCLDISNEDGKQWLITHFGKVIDTLDLIQLDEINLDRQQEKYLDESILTKYQFYHPYLIKRHLSENICKRFKVGYDDVSKSIVFPVWDSQNHLIMLTRRSVLNKTFLIEQDKEKPLYLLNEILNKHYNKVIITEGQIDALTAWDYGFPAIATLGGLSDKQVDILNKSNINFVITMFDNDKAGKTFTKKLINKLNKNIFVIETQLPSNKKDINDLTYDEFWECLNKSGIYKENNVYESSN